jgi:hypothetical protein
MAERVMCKRCGIRRASSVVVMHPRDPQAEEGREALCGWCRGLVQNDIDFGKFSGGDSRWSFLTDEELPR